MQKERARRATGCGRKLDARFQNHGHGRGGVWHLPSEDIQIVDGTRSNALDARMPPEKKAARDYTSSRAVVYALRPWHWREKFPMVNRIDRDQRDAMIAKYKDVLPFPRM